MFAHLQLGERNAGEQLLESCRRFVGEHPIQYARALTHMIEASFAMLDGRFAEARVSTDAAEAIAVTRESTGVAGHVAGQRIVLALLRGQVGHLVPALRAVRARLPAMRMLTAALALAYALAGDLEAALSGLASIVDGLDRLPFDWSRLPTLVLAAEAAFRAQAPMAAGRLQDELAPFAGLNAVSHNATMFFGSVSQGLGWLAAARGRSAEAVEHFQAALAVHTTIRSPLWCERSQRAIEEVGTSQRTRTL